MSFVSTLGTWSWYGVGVSFVSTLGTWWSYIVSVIVRVQVGAGMRPVLEQLAKHFAHALQFGF